MERVTIDAGGKVSVLDHGGPGPLVVCVHGLEGSAYNWNLIAPHLAETHRVVAPDLSGFGYTEPLDGGSTVERNAQLIADVIDHYGSTAILIGNSMGGLVAILAAELFPEKVSSLVLIDPAAPVFSWFSVSPGAAARLSVPLIPFLGKWLIDGYRSSVTVEQGVEEALHFVAADADALDPEVRLRAIEIAELRREQPWATDTLIEATNSIAPYVVRKRRFADLIHRISQPTLLVHGSKDELIQVEAANWLAHQRPDWTVAYLEGLGHVPMLEDPGRFLAVFDTWEEAAVSRSAGSA
ncbi:MAG: alpha/beta hydrolase [Actinomycetia bacterium]|nr:alpha/beta hydrolase [Actinomycetes bacterium]